MRHPLVKAFLDATRYGWQRRGAILGLLLVLWLPVELVVAHLPAERRAIAKMALESLIDPLWVGALLHLCRADLRRKPIGLVTALRRARTSYPRLFGIRTVLEVRVLFGLVAGVVPGVVMFVRYALLDVLAVSENVGPTQCRTRSASLVENHAIGVLFLLVLANLTPLGLGALVDPATEAVDSLAVTAIANTISCAMTAFLPLTLFEFYRGRITPL